MHSLEAMSTASIEEIPIVRDFLDVFSLEIENLPLEREVNFSIDLPFGTRPTSIEPYRMSPLKLRELNEQFKGFLARDFIKPSASP